MNWEAAFEGGLLAAGADKGSNSDRTDWPASPKGNANCNKGFSSASLEGQIGKGIGKTCADKPVILSFGNNTPSPFPPDGMPATSPAPPVAKIRHGPPNDSEISLSEPEVEPNGVRELASHVEALMDSSTGIREGQRTAQEVKLPSLNAMKAGNAVAANVNDTHTADIEGENALNCTIVANFVDVEALTSELCNR